MVHDLNQRMDYAKDHTDLPAEPNVKRIEEFVMDINRRALGV